MYVVALLLASTFALCGLATPLVEGPTPAFKNEVISLHNKARAHYGARPVTWNDALYPATLQWANACKFQHSQSGGKYGENLFAASGNNVNFAQSINGWMSESAKYNYNNPVFSSATGHFTQVVWKSTNQVACAMVDCRAGTIFGQASKYTVCRYSPPGNFQGQFAQNVGRPVGTKGTDEQVVLMTVD